MDKLEELRALLLRREREQLGELRTRLDDKERRTREIAGVLPQAVKLSHAQGSTPDELSRALRPAVEGSIQASLEQRPEMFVEALHPIIGSIVRRSIAESLRGLIQSLNKTLEHTFSWQGLKWRYEALRTGKSFAEVVMLRSMIYRVEELFLIHRETSLTLLHVSADAVSESDSTMVAGMLSAIRDFAHDALKAGADDSLDEFRIGDLEGWVASGRHAYLAAAIRGSPPRELRLTLEETIDTVHLLKGAELTRFDGDAAPFESLRPELEHCLRAQYRQEKSPAGGVGGVIGAGRYARAWLALAAVAGLVALAVAGAVRAENRWQDFLRALNAEPGIAVTAARRDWWGNWRGRAHVAGLRDPLAADPAPLAQAAGIDPARVDYDWKEYLALDPVSIFRRFQQRFPVADDARTRLKLGRGGVITVYDTAPYEWLERVRREGTQVPGVSRVVETNLEVTYDPALSRARFVEAFPPPPGVSAEVGADGTLVLTGEAGHGWLTRVRAGAREVAGIASVDDRGAVDVDEQAFGQSRAVIESAFVYFLVNKDNFATEGFAALSRLPDEIRRCRTTARHVGTDIQIKILGSADGTGPEAKNADLSQRRANAVRDFLVSCGLEAGLFEAVGTGAPAPAPGEGGKPVAEQSQRRVAFHVVTRVSLPP